MENRGTEERKTCGEKKKSNSRKEGVKEGCAQEEGGVWRERENDVDVCLLFQL